MHPRQLWRVIKYTKLYIHLTIIYKKKINLNIHCGTNSPPPPKKKLGPKRSSHLLSSSAAQVFQICWFFLVTSSERLGQFSVTFTEINSISSFYTATVIKHRKSHISHYTSMISSGELDNGFLDRFEIIQFKCKSVSVILNYKLNIRNIWFVTKCLQSLTKFTIKACFDL